MLDRTEIENLQAQLRIAAQAAVEARMLERAAEQTRSFLRSKYALAPNQWIGDDGSIVTEKSPYVPAEPSEQQPEENGAEVA